VNAAHAHLILNHLPVLGIPFGLFVGFWGSVRRSDEVKKLALVVLLLAGLSALPAYLTGSEAEEVVEDIPGITSVAVSEHEDAAKTALVSALMLSAVALAGLLLWGRKPSAAKALLWVALAAALGVSALFAWTANLGGHIRHPEISQAAGR
jgi:hypothetical protein